VDKLTKIMDAAVILLEGGTDLDLTILDKPPEPEGGEAKKDEPAASKPTADGEKASKEVVSKLPNHEAGHALTAITGSRVLS